MDNVSSTESSSPQGPSSPGTDFEGPRESLARWWAEKLGDGVSECEGGYSIFLTFYVMGWMGTATEYLADHRVCARALARAQRTIITLEEGIDSDRATDSDIAEIQELSYVTSDFSAKAWEHPAESMRELALALGWEPTDD